MTDAEQNHTDFRASLDTAVQVLKETILIAQPGQSINMALNPMVPNRTSKIIGFT